jgi:TRAP-type C4-dicarboxylate transport system substrate-binding protein
MTPNKLSSHLFGLGRRLLLGLCAAALLSGAPSLAEAKKQTIKLGTLAPEGSPWFTAVKRMGQRWKEVSGGEVELKIYPGGVAGDEGDMLRKMRIGQLHAATITGVGLGRITRATMAMQVPMMIQSYEELDYVRERMRTKVAAELEQGGFVVLNWGDAGWVHFFSKGPAKTPADFKKLKMLTWSGDPESEKAWKAGGFNVVPLSATDVLSSLQTGIIEGFATTPLFALSSQWFGLAKNMVKVNWAPLSGATVVNRADWEKIEPALRAKLLEIAAEEGTKALAEVRRLGDGATKAMQDRGLAVHAPSAAELAEWQKTAEAAYPVIRGEVVPAAFFDEVQRLVRDFRAGKK